MHDSLCTRATGVKGKMRRAPVCGEMLAAVGHQVGTRPSTLQANEMKNYCSRTQAQKEGKANVWRKVEGTVRRDAERMCAFQTQHLFE